jgi:hypothetical protein
MNALIAQRLDSFYIKKEAVAISYQPSAFSYQPSALSRQASVSG